MNVRDRFFPQRVVGAWNAPPEVVVEADTFRDRHTDEGDMEKDPLHNKEATMCILWSFSAMAHPL